jgi:FMN phosphatase YigB (HAD superfamily)
MSQKPLVVLDFDGTFTDAEAEGAGFADAYLQEFSELVGRDVKAEWAKAQALLSNPERGWEVNGFVVAPANCDPYIRSTCLAYEVCERLGLMKNRELRSDVLSVVYGFCYRFTKTVFRPEAKAVLQRLLRSGAHVRVVTNSDTKVVQKKLEQLGFTQLDVTGSAKKFVVKDDAQGDPRFGALVDIAVTGLNRPLKVRRPHYFNVLDRLWHETGVKPAETLVCGDIFELDLALPLALGCQGHLLDRPNTLAYEKTAMAAFGARTTTSPSLEMLADRVEAMVTNA